MTPRRKLPSAIPFVLPLAISLLASVSTTAQSPNPTVVRRDFHSEETSKLQPIGTVHRDVPGPRPPLYPDFDSNNTAIQLDGSGSHLEFDDPGPQSDYDFANQFLSKPGSKSIR